MTITNVTPQDSFDSERQKINTLATSVGDPSALSTPVTTDLVSGIDSVNVEALALIKSVVVRATFLAS